MTSAQDGNFNTVNNQFWVDFNPSYNISDRFDLSFKVGAKANYPQSWYKFYTSPEISYKIPKLIFEKLKYNERVYAGFDLYYIYFTTTPNVLEISPYQGYTLSWPNRKRIIIKHNVELGERFQWETSNWNYSFGMRVSYEASITLRFHGDILKYSKGFYLTASMKFWWDLIAAAVFNDVVRITPGIGYVINSKWKAAFLIGYNYTRNLSSDKFNTDNIIYRFRVYYSLN